jgi:hypothetical protein
MPDLNLRGCQKTRDWQNLWRVFVDSLWREVAPDKVSIYGHDVVDLSNYKYPPPPHPLQLCNNMSCLNLNYRP